MRLSKLAATLLLGSTLLASGAYAQNAPGTDPSGVGATGGMNATGGGAPDVGPADHPGEAPGAAAEMNSGSGTSAAEAGTSEPEAGIDTNATASTGFTDEDNAAFDRLGEAGRALFADESRTSLRPNNELTSVFSELNEEEQSQLRDMCMQVRGAPTGHSASVLGMCDSINAL